MNEAAAAQLYQRFLTTTGDALAASNLVLAAALMDRQPVQADGPLTVIEAAQLMNVGKRTIYDLCNLGRLKSHRIGTGKGAIRILRGDVEDYQAASVVEPKQTAAMRYLDSLN